MFGAVGAGFVRVNLESVWKKESLPGMGRLLVCVADGFVRVTTLRASGRLR